MAKENHPIHAKITGPVVMIGFGSIGKGTLPLIERHFDYDKSRFTVIDPNDADKQMLDERGIRDLHHRRRRVWGRRVQAATEAERGGQRQRAERSDPRGSGLGENGHARDSKGSAAW